MGGTCGWLLTLSDPLLTPLEILACIYKNVGGRTALILEFYPGNTDGSFVRVNKPN